MAPTRHDRGETGTRAPLHSALLAALAGFKLLLHLVLAGQYGYFRDELYFLDCGRHLAFGYVDHAPLIALVSRAALALGGSLFALRVFPAVAGAGLVALAMLIAWRLGGGAFAQALAGVAVIAAPIFQALHGMLTMNAFGAAILALIVIASAITAPMTLPILPPEKFLAYEHALHFSPPKTEVGHRGPLPQHFGDRFGWPELVAQVARIYDALPAEDRARACIFANNYGEAGAMNLFGPRYGLPPTVSAHQTHFFWGPRGCTGEVLIVLQDDRETLEGLCASVEEAGVHTHPWGMAEENNPIFVCRGLHPPLPEMWPRLKKWN